MKSCLSPAILCTVKDKGTLGNLKHAWNSILNRMSLAEGNGKEIIELLKRLGRELTTNTRVPCKSS
jgi:hypothetical protein